MANTDNEPKATVVSINALAIIEPPPFIPRIDVSSGAKVNPLKKVNAKSSTRFNPAFFLAAKRPNKTANSKITNIKYMLDIVAAKPNPIYAPALAANKEAANSW